MKNVRAVLALLSAMTVCMLMLSYSPDAQASPEHGSGYVVALPSAAMPTASHDAVAAPSSCASLVYVAHPIAASPTAPADLAELSERLARPYAVRPVALSLGYLTSTPMRWPERRSAVSTSGMTGDNYLRRNMRLQTTTRTYERRRMDC